MMDSVDHDACGIDLVEQWTIVRIGVSVVLLGNRFGLRGIGVGDSNQLDFGQPRENAGVSLAEVSNSNHRHPKFHAISK
jgi:hypothetical protein